MSNEPDDFDDAEDDGADGTDPKAPRALRQQVKKLNAQLEELQKERDQLRAADRSRSVADELEKHGAPKRLAKYVDSDDVLKWLEENGDDFGWSAQVDDDDEETMEEADRISRATRSAPPAPSGKRVDPAFIRNTPREELIKMGILRAS